MAGDLEHVHGQAVVDPLASTASPAGSRPEPGEEVGDGVLDLALLEHRDRDAILAEHPLQRSSSRS